MADTVVIVTGAGSLTDVACRAVPGDAAVIAADGGLDHARAAGLTPRLVVGDLDSITDHGMRWATEHARIDPHPPAKASTDTELAVDEALCLSPTRLIVIGSDDGTRIDHVIATIGVLGQSRLAGLRLEAWWGSSYVAVVHPGHPVTLMASPGTVFSVLALHGAADGVSVMGARWELDRATLPPLSGLGVSNEVTAPPLTIGVTSGVATVIVPDGSRVDPQPPAEPHPPSDQLGETP